VKYTEESLANHKICNNNNNNNKFQEDDKGYKQTVMLEHLDLPRDKPLHGQFLREISVYRVTVDVVAEGQFYKGVGRPCFCSTGTGSIHYFYQGSYLQITVFSQV